MSNFSSEACPDWAESMYVRQCWDLMLPESPRSLDLIHYVYSLAWTVDIFREFVTLAMISVNRNSDGISCKALIMYFFAGACRFANDTETSEWIFFFPKYTYLVFAFLLLAVGLFFRSRSDNDDDDDSFLLLLFGCTAVTLMHVDNRLDRYLVQLSMIIESAALIPQFRMDLKKRTVSPTSGFFITSWFFSKCFMCLYYLLIGYLCGNRALATGDSRFRDFGSGSMLNGTAILLGIAAFLHQIASVHDIQKQMGKHKQVNAGDGVC